MIRSKRKHRVSSMDSSEMGAVQHDAQDAKQGFAGSRAAMCLEQKSCSANNRLSIIILSKHIYVLMIMTVTMELAGGLRVWAEVNCTVQFFLHAIAVQCDRLCTLSASSAELCCEVSSFTKAP